MVKLVWDKVGERLYETGTSKGVLFVQSTLGAYGEGVAWNGLASVKQSPDGAEESPVFANNHKYLSLTSAENFNGTIEAYTYPDEFAACDGSAEVSPGVHLGQQGRTAFGLAYSTVVGNDTVGEAFGEKIHLIYGAKAAPSERAYETINDDPNALLFSWGITTTPESVSDDRFKPTSYVVVDSTKADPEDFAILKDMIYGTAAEESSMPSVDDIIAMFGTV